ncbi:RNA 2',3'-cyclic phosphodiesterase [Fictibacillus sp. UD]|uniref:RNA 2',3'-cyclic phosphodiesterase n=1 Tax=Fictibacillus sp. UD TaxID=3038777 RepID=UPI003745FD71
MQRHYFIAVKLPAEVKTKLAEFCKHIKKDHHFKTWVHLEDLHITLAFLGSASTRQLETLHSLLKEEVTNHDEFSLKVDHFGFFGNKQNPRIFWAGIKKQHSLYRLQKQVSYVCAKAGFTLENRPYAPHITLARKHIDSEDRSINAADWWKQYGEEIPFNVEKIVIYETHTEKQPKYEIVQSFSLQN